MESVDRAGVFNRAVPCGFGILLLCAWLLPARLDGAERSEHPPNVLLVLADDLGWNDLSFRGNSYFETPHIDRLARESAWFERAYSAAPVCSPSRGALLTGRTPARTGLTGHINGSSRGPTGRHRHPVDGLVIPPDDFDYLPPSEVTIAEALAPLGYESLMVGKWHLGGGEPSLVVGNRRLGGGEEHTPPRQGFAGIGYMPGGALDAPLHHYTYFFPFFDRTRSPDFRIPGLEGGEPGDFLTDRLTDEAIGWLERRDGTTPFLLYFAPYAVHTPLEAPEPLVRKYEAKLKDHPSQKSAAYGGLVEILDRNVGRLLAALDRLGQADETIVIFTSDNGGTTRATDNAPLREGKGFLYEGGIRVPMIVKWPGVTRPGDVVDEPVISHDVFPTVLEIATGLREPASGRPLDGKSLVPLLRRDHTFAREALYWYYPQYNPRAQRPGAAIRVGNWKLIQNYDPDEIELFDLAADPGESRNLAEAEPERARALRQRLQAELRNAKARLPRANPARRPAE